MSEKYSGWANYETWAVALWADNDQGSEEMMIEMAASADSAYDLADTLRGMYHENSPLEDEASVYTDLLRAALDEVDWSEIAEHYIEKAKERDTA